MRDVISREAALATLREYNKEPFHIQHALTVEGVMRWYANELGYGDEADFWATAGLLHDIDFEMWPEEHCVKAPELMKKAGCGDDLIHAVCSHGYGLCCDVEPEHEMEKVLFAADELTGLIGAAAKMRPSKSVMDMEYIPRFAYNPDIHGEPVISCFMTAERRTVARHNPVVFPQKKK